MTDWRRWAVAGVIGVLVIFGLFSLPSLGDLISAAFVLATGQTLRAVAYVLLLLMGAAIGVLAMRAGYGKIALLFGVLCVADLISLVAVLFSVFGVDKIYTDWLRALLTPVVVTRAIIYGWIVSEAITPRTPQSTINE